ncbi:hypothetical protein O1611_g10496 [Lasiodiplodia mahajangana]|uniref:Uncharacterized protein n=1 Tax=Lasiodiplodia mahajangana TaxID=1108764 RepID=A0ACC2IXI8_9PEZI|nr:hypothetical protein O1611_g10496 [Lasiodiplodia mahajangana]
MDLKSIKDHRANIDLVKSILWQQTHSAQEIETFLESVKDLQTQALIQSSLANGMGILRGPRPQQSHQRIRNLVQFTCNTSDKFNDKEKGRQGSLRSLDYSSLILCSLAYTVREIKEMKQEQFDFLIMNIADFVEIHKLSTECCEDSIRSSVMACKKRETTDPAAFKTFEKLCNEAFRYESYRESPSSGVDSLRTPAPGEKQLKAEPQCNVDISNPPETGVPIAANLNVSAREEPQAKPFQAGSGVGQLSTEYLTSQTSNEAANLPWGAGEIVKAFTAADKNSLDALDHGLLQAMYNSAQWELEEQNNAQRTNCMRINIPRDEGKDALITIWVNREEGFKICNKLEMDAA